MRKWILVLAAMAFIAAACGEETPPADDGTPTESPAEEIVVRPGDSLLTIAREALRDAGVEDPSDGDIAAYWSVVIDRNRAHLPDPDNPDLIFPGDRLVLPPLEAAIG
jgi:nucleoid-associated protein YgaU